MNLYVGTSGYSYKEWKGPFYPEDLPDKQMLRFYGERFRSVEINNTFYRMPKASMLEAWAAEVPADFKFVLKAPQQITHIKRLKEAGDSVAYLLKVAADAEGAPGPAAVSVAALFEEGRAAPARVSRAAAAGSPVAMEFRHESWFDDETLALLREHQAALCIAEAEDGVEVPFVSTAKWGYLRLRRPDYGDAELKAWADRVKQQDWSDAFIFFKHEDEGKGPLMAKRFLELAA